MAGLSLPALGQDLFWAGGTNGQFNVATNWNSVAPNLSISSSTNSGPVPGSGNIAIIDADTNNGTLQNDYFFGIQSTPIVITLSTTTTSGNVVQGLVVSNYLFDVATGPVTLTNNTSQPLTINGTGSNNGDFIVDGFETFNFAGGFQVQMGKIVIGDNNPATFGNGNQAGSGTFNLTSGTFTFDPATNQTTSMYVGYSQSTGTGFINATGTVNVGVSGSGTNGGSSATMTTGNTLVLGYNGGNGTMNINNASTLQTGTQSGVSYLIQLGANGGVVSGSNTVSTGSVGTLTLNDTSGFVLNSGADLQLGTIATGASVIKNTGGTGVINQGVSGGTGGPTVKFLGTSTVEIGTYSGGNGTYNLYQGSLSASNSYIAMGFVSGSTGTFNQYSGTFVTSTNTGLFVGVDGRGYFNMSGGSDQFQDGLIFWDAATSSGTAQQSGGTLSVTNGLTEFGPAGSGTYYLSGGSAILGGGATIGGSSALNVSGGTLSLGNNANVGIVVSSGGSITQSGGTVTVDPTLGQSITLNSASYNLNGGTLKIGDTTTTNGFTGTGGSLNFGGGTLQITSANAGTYTEDLKGSVTNTSIIDAATYSGTTTVNITGTLTGTGGLTFLGASNTIFNLSPTVGPDSFGGAMTINGGTLNASMDDVGGSSSLNILGSTSTLNLALSTGGNAYAGGINGSGLLNVKFKTAGDALVIDNASTFTGNIVLGSNGKSGTLQVYNGTFGNISDNNTGSGVTIGGNPLVAFSGGVTVPTSGTVTLTGATYTGLTTVTNNFTLIATSLAGGLTNDGTTTATTIAGNVINAGTLTATSVGGYLNNTGTLGSGVALGTTPTFTIGGAFTSPGTILIRNAGVNTDYYQINGTTDLTGGSAILSGYGSTGTAKVVLNSTGMLTGGVPSYTVAGSHLLYNATLTENGNQLLLNAVQNGTAAYAQTQNQLAVANSIDPLLITGNLTTGIGSAFNNMTAQQIPVALDELSPEVLQYSRDIAFENSTFLVSAVNGALANVRSGYAGLDASGLSVVSNGFESGLGRSLNSLLAYDPPSFNRAAPNGVNYYPQPADYTPSSGTSSSSSDSSPAPSSRSISDTPNPDTTISPSSMSHSEPNFTGPVLSEFIIGNVVLADMNQDQSAPNAAPQKASYTAGGATAGISFRMTNNLAAGVLFDYNHTDAKTDSSGSKTKVDTFSPGAYATYFYKGFYVNGLFSFGYNDYSNTRAIPFIGAQAKSSPTGEQYVTNLDFGYDFQPKNHREWIYGPTLGLTYTHLDIDSFTETGAGPADLAVNSQSLDSLRSRLGAHVIYQARSGSLLFQPNLSIMWQHEYLDNPGITSQLSIPGTTPFTIQTATTGKDSALIGTGVTVTLDNSMAIYLNYLADVGEHDFLAQSIVGGFKASF
jgi:uncharacterized protein YhjY with autotransporter beta-barrel domain